MNSEKEFKDKLKDKLGSKEFRFDEANWEQARQLIDASREEKKRSILPFILFGLLFIGSGILGVYLLNSPTASANNLAVRSDNNVTPVAKTQIINTESSNEKNTTETKPEIQNTEVVTEKAQTKNDQPIDKDQAIKTNAKEVKANGKKERKTTATKTAKEGNIVVVAIAKTKVKKERITNAVANTKNKTRSVQPAEIKAEPVIEENTTEAVTTVTATSINEPTPNLPIETVVTATTSEIPVAETKAVLTAAVDSIAKPVATENFTRTPVHFISFEAGTNYLFGWNNPGKKDANGFNPVIGLNYSNIITKGVAFSFGIHYTMVRNLSYSSHDIKTTRYNFGEESDVMVFTPTTLHYFVVPIRLSYAPDEKNVFGLACNVGYLFNVNSNVELYSQRANQKGNATVLKTSGYTQGFKTFDTQLSVFYRRNLYKDLWLHTEFMYGLTDVKDNTFFNSNVKEKNVGIKVTLIYNLFKK